METESKKIESNEPAAEKFQPIIDLYSQRKIKQALDLIKGMQEEFPKSAFLCDFAGACNAELMNFHESILSYKDAINLRPNFSDAYNNMGNVLIRMGSLDAAIESYNQAITIEPNYAIAHLNLAKAKLDKLDFLGAKDAFRLAIKYDGESHDAYYLLANLQKSQGDLEEAINCYKKAIKINPDFAEAYNNLGNAIQSNLKKGQGDLEEAITCYKKVIKINPEFAEAYNNMGTALRARGDIDKSIVCFKKALLISSNFSNAHNNLGIALNDKGSLSKAIESFKEAIRIEPFNPEAFYNMGDALLAKGDLDLAIDAYKKAINLKPDFFNAYLNLGNAFRDKGSSELAIKCYIKALEYNPSNAIAEFNQALAYLDKEDFIQGWQKYERRWDSVSFEFDYLNSIVPKWQPGDRGRTLLWQEQGIGDVLMFSTIVSEFYSKCDKLIIQLDSRLIPIFSRSFPDDIVYFKSDEDVPNNEYDFHIPMGSLPLYFRNNLDSFKNGSCKFLKPDEKLSLKLKKNIQKNSNDCIVGISWQGGSKVESASRNRSMKLIELASIFDNERVNLVNLQYGDTEKELKMLESQCGILIKNISEIDNLNDLDGLSALINACDYIVSIDNLTVHLAGALGKKTFTLLPFSPDWRWGLTRDLSLWHSSINLFRQQKINDWSATLNDLKTHFKNILN